MAVMISIDGVCMIAFPDRNSRGFRAVPYMKPYCDQHNSMLFEIRWKRQEIIVWNHMVPGMKLHGFAYGVASGSAQINFASIFLILYAFLSSDCALITQCKISSNSCQDLGVSRKFPLPLETLDKILNNSWTLKNLEIIDKNLVKILI